MPKTATPPKRPIRAVTMPEPVPYDDDNLVISYSELDTYRQCPLKHFIGYKNRWTKPPAEDSPLTKGTHWHAVEETHYGVIKAWQEAHGQIRSIRVENQVLRMCRLAIEEAGLFGTPGEQTENQALVQWMYEGYVEKYGVDADWQILGIEYRMAEWLIDPDGNESEFVLKAKLDLVIRKYSDGTIWIIDHKSGKDLPSQMDLEIDDQFGLYTWLMQHRGLRVMGSIHNATRTTRNAGDYPENWGVFPDDDPKGRAGLPMPLKSGIRQQTLEGRMHRTYLNRGDTETLNIARDAWAVAMNAYPPEGRELPLYSSPDPRQCGWKCDFKEAHLDARSGRDLVSSLEARGFVQNFERH